MSDITITLDEETAVVLFDCISRWDYDEHAFELRDKAEEYAMLKLMGGLEKSLVAPFQRDYAKLVLAARTELLKRSGDV